MSTPVARTIRGTTLLPSSGTDTRRVAPQSAISSHALFGGERQIVIDHAGQRYCLRITQNNKLILTK